MRRSLLGVLILLGVLLGATFAHQSRASGLGPKRVWIPLFYNPALPTPAPDVVRIGPSCSQFDAPGNDNANLNEEYVCFENHGPTSVRLDGCRVQDEVGKSYTFSPFALAPGQTVRLHTGSGTDTWTDLYWGMNSAVWNNDGDTVSLYDATGGLIDRYTY